MALSKWILHPVILLRLGQLCTLRVTGICAFSADYREEEEVGGRWVSIVVSALGLAGGQCWGLAVPVTCRRGWRGQRPPCCTQQRGCGESRELLIPLGFSCSAWCSRTCSKPLPGWVLSRSQGCAGALPPPEIPALCPRSCCPPAMVLWGESVSLDAALCRGGGQSCLPCVLTSFLPFWLFQG